jgi:hypothetical protein
LNATASAPEGDPLSYNWSCTGGTLDNTNVLTPVYSAPGVDHDTSYSCTLTATDYRGGSSSATAGITVKKIISTLYITSSVRDITQNQTSYQQNITVNPGDAVEFRIEVKATDTASNVTITTTLPPKVIYKGNLKLNGNSVLGNMIIGLQLGNMSNGDSKIITFEGLLSPVNYFSDENTVLSVVTKGTANYMLEVSDDSTINVVKAPFQSVSGTTGGTTSAVITSPTSVNTGISNKIIDSVLLPLVISLVVIFLFSSKLIYFDEWLDRRKEKIKQYQTVKTLKSKIKHIKRHEREIYETWKK